MSKKKEERLSKIREILGQKEKVRNLELAQELNITVETLRHDLEFLEEQNIIKREHGYTRLNNSLREMPVLMRQNENMDLKRRIAVRAFREIQNGQIVFLDSGSTVLSGIDALRNKKDITIVTNSLPVAIECSKMNHKIVLIGGMILNAGLRTTGVYSTDMLDHIQLDLAITGTSGIEGATGFTTNDFEIWGFRTHVLQKTKKMIVVCDKNKFHMKAPYEDVSFHEVDTLITNQLTKEELEVVKDIKNIIMV